MRFHLLALILCLQPLTNSPSVFGQETMTHQERIDSLLSEVEWESLFDGESLDNWEQKGGKAKYLIADDCIVGTTVPNTPNSFLCTKQSYGNFAFTCEFKVHPLLNSGIQIRSNSLADYKNGRVHGYQAEIDASDRSWTAGIYDEGRRGWLDNHDGNRAARFAFKQNGWNQLFVLAQGDSIRTWLNGVPAADLTDDMTAEGFIALQVHGVGGRQDPLEVRWRNLKICEVANEKTIADSVVASQQTSVTKAGAEVKELGSGYKFTEGPSVGADGLIYFSDIPNERVHVYDPANGTIEIFREESGKTNGTLWTPNDAIICCEGGNRRVVRIEPGKEPTVLADSFDGKKLNSPNDVDIDGVGGLFFTDPRYGDRSNMEMEVEGVYYLNRGRKISRVIDDIKRPNGIVLSPDEKTLYVADTGDRAIWKYDLKQPGKPTNKQKFAETSSDGMTVDQAGNVYLTNGPFVHVYRPDGELLEKIEFPQNPANVTFGGPNNSTLFVTARTGFYSIETNMTGGQAFANPKN